MEQEQHSTKAWRICYTRPSQEFRAQQNLQSQGFECYLPTIVAQRIVRHQLVIRTEPLFERYCFVRGRSPHTNWAPIRSTPGVSHLLRFGANPEPATIADALIQAIALLCQKASTAKPLFTPGQPVQIAAGPLKGLAGLFQQIQQSDDGDARAQVLLVILGKTHPIKLLARDLRAA